MYLHNNYQQHQHYHQKRHYEKPTSNTLVYSNNNRSIFRHDNLDQKQCQQTRTPFQHRSRYSPSSNGYSKHYQNCHPNEVSPPLSQNHSRHNYNNESMKRYYAECNLYMPNLTSRPTFDEANEEVSPLPPQEERPRNTPTVNPPPWCAPAKGESTLEPIGQTKEAHLSMDLTKKPCYRIGRSPYSNIPLYHTTSSRNHAILYHHPKTSTCFIVDNYSVHGTFVDGVRIKAGKEIRIRRGAIIRFGSYGCPTFILKSFTVSVYDLMANLGCVMDSLLNKDRNNLIHKQSSPSINLEKCNNQIDDNTSSKSNAEDEKKKSSEEITSNNNTVQEYFKSAQHWVQQKQSTSRRNITANTTANNEDNSLTTTKPSNSNSNSDNILTCIRGDGGGVACISNEKEIPYASLTVIHTRLNAIGCSTIHDVLHKHDKYVNANKQTDMINGYDKFVSLSQLYSSSDESKRNLMNVSSKSSLLGKKRKRGDDKLRAQSPPSSPKINNISFTASSKYKSILHSVSMDEDCITPYSSSYIKKNTILPRRRKIRFEDENNNQEQVQQDEESFYSHPQVSFELYDTNNGSNASNEVHDNNNYNYHYYNRS